MNNNFSTRSHKEMIEVNMNKNASGPDFYYYMIRGGTEKRNVTIWEPGLVDKEYIKSYGHYHVDNIPETYKILQGQGILLMQKRKTDKENKPIDNEIEIFKAISVKEGDEVFIDGNMGHLLINTGKTWLVSSDDSPVDQNNDSASMPNHADYKSVRKMGGFAYFVIEKDGSPVLVKNPNYISVPEAQIEEYKN